MRQTLSQRAAKRFVFDMGIDWMKSEQGRSPENDKWELTDDKSYDTVRNESDDAAFPIVVLRNNKFYDAITSDYAKELLAL